HSATLGNDGSTVIFTDEWGGGTGARCRPTDELSWGADAIFDIVGGELQFRSYYKMPAAQSTTENCVAHNASLVPVPGRDILAQAWYQGGLSLIDFTDSANPVEIGFFDRGPISPSALQLGGFWSTYWYNGHIYGSEIARGFDVFGLVPSEHLTEAEIAAAEEVRLDELNPQHQSAFTWAPSRAVARARFDQLLRTCTSTITGRHNGPLTVASGVTCLDGATVNGPVTVQSGASLLALGASVSGPVTATSGADVQLYDTTVRGAVTVTRSTASVAVVDSTVRGPVTLTSNATGAVEPVVAGNDISGPLSCSGNSPAPLHLGSPNTVHGPASGQCATLR
ncbi:MAG TPA: hypothetical protein VIL36_08020, partial [Acidimicrobiales bacterium]